MRLLIESRDHGVASVKALGSISAEHAPSEDGDPLARLLGPNCYSFTVLLDLSATENLASSGLAWLLATHRRFRDAGGRLVIHSAPPLVSQVVRLMSADRVLEMAESKRKALAKVKNGAPSQGSAESGQAATERKQD